MCSCTQRKCWSFLHLAKWRFFFKLGADRGNGSLFRPFCQETRRTPTSPGVLCSVPWPVPGTQESLCTRAAVQTPWAFWTGARELPSDVPAGLRGLENQENGGVCLKQSLRQQGSAVTSTVSNLRVTLMTWDTEATATHPRPEDLGEQTAHEKRKGETATMVLIGWTPLTKWINGQANKSGPSEAGDRIRNLTKRSIKRKHLPTLTDSSYTSGGRIK